MFVWCHVVAERFLFPRLLSLISLRRRGGRSPLLHNLLYLICCFYTLIGISNWSRFIQVAPSCPCYRGVQRAAAVLPRPKRELRVVTRLGTININSAEPYLRVITKVFQFASWPTDKTASSPPAAPQLRPSPPNARRTTTADKLLLRSALPPYPKSPRKIFRPMISLCLSKAILTSFTARGSKKLSP